MVTWKGKKATRPNKSVHEWCMSQVPIGPDGDRDKSWATAGVLCVHGAEQGESLYSMTPPPYRLPLSVLLFLLVSHSKRLWLWSFYCSCYSAGLSWAPNTVTLKMVHPNTLFLSLPFIQYLCHLLTPFIFERLPHWAPRFSSERITVFFVSLPRAAAVWDSDSRRDRNGSKGCGRRQDVCSTKHKNRKRYMMVCCRVPL